MNNTLIDERLDSGNSTTSWFRRIWRIFKRFCLVAFLLVAMFLIIGFFYERSALKSIAATMRPPGKRVDIGGRSIHLHVQGEGSPTVIFESGLGASSIVWNSVAPEVAKSTRVVTYDRAGLGWSDPGPRSDVDSIVADLRAALNAERIEGPYVLVGQSIGGIYIRMFSYRDPMDVVGIVLVDSSHEDQFDRFPEPMRRKIRRAQTILPVIAQSARFGIPRMWLEFRSRAMPNNKLPKESNEAIRKLSTSHATLRTVGREFSTLEEIGKQVRAEQVPWGDLPLVVLTAGRKNTGLPPQVSPDEISQLWIGLQKELASRSTNSTHRIAEGTGHNIHVEQPEIVVEEILRLLETIRTKDVSSGASAPSGLGDCRLNAV
jgi:pimeloyl-ACP methyl ester carboxylesterase